MSLTFDLVTPQARLEKLTGAAYVSAPGVNGSFGVLPGHVPFVSLLADGVVEVEDGSGHLHRYQVNGGFAEVNGAGVTILAEQAQKL